MRTAIMDIGYNAIRAVVYEDDTLGAPEIFNSKFKSDILNLLSHESIDIKHQTYLVIQYFLHVFEKLEVKDIKCVATAVLRNNPRADEFVQYVKDTYNFEIDVIPGEEEAKLTAQGLITSMKNPHGIAADLGGGSLELIEINNGKIERVNSLELGTKVLSSSNIQNEKEIIPILEKHYKNQSYNNLYLIGGALRFIGRLYMDFVQYPLKNLHNLEIKTEKFASYLDKLESSTHDPRHKIGRRRINSSAIFIAKAMISVFKPSNIIISTYGLKEGVRFNSLSTDEKAKDIVHAKVEYTCNFDVSKTNWDSYLDAINPLLTSTNYAETIKLAIMLLSLQHKFDRTLHPEAISEFILSSEIPFTHKMRMELALILSYATNSKPKTKLVRSAKKILRKEEYNNSQIIGYFLNIAESVDGPFFTTPSFSIEMRDNYLEINSDKILPRSVFEKVCNHLKSIAFARKMNSNLMEGTEIDQDDYA
jgi:exopolyphosphatase/guanosine-5'-triphosphate,3'-diphosphate pyrophosphatase